MIVTDIEYKKKFRVAVALYTIFMLALLAGTGFMVFKFLKNRKELIQQQKIKDEYEKKVERRKAYLDQLQLKVNEEET